VIGAGNTAMDCLRVAKRLGTRRSVACTAAPKRRRRRGSRSCATRRRKHRVLLPARPVEILTDADGNVRGMKVQKMELGSPTRKGAQPMPLDEFVELDCDTVIYALGTKANRSSPSRRRPRSQQMGIHRGRSGDTGDERAGCLRGGDIVTGAATVILAMGAGRRAARRSQLAGRNKTVGR